MRKVMLIMLALAFPCVSLLADDVPPAWKQVPVKPKEEKGDNRPVVNTPLHKSPQKTNTLDAYYDASQGYLHVAQAEADCVMTYIIRDAEGREMMRGVATGNATHYYNVELMGLPIGVYQLLVEIDGREYEAWLTVE